MKLENSRLPFQKKKTCNNKFKLFTNWRRPPFWKVSSGISKFFRACYSCSFPAIFSDFMFLVLFVKQGKRKPCKPWRAYLFFLFLLASSKGTSSDTPHLGKVIVYFVSSSSTPILKKPKLCTLIGRDTVKRILQMIARMIRIFYDNDNVTGCMHMSIYLLENLICVLLVLR